jgi:hypothetical protein
MHLLSSVTVHVLKWCLIKIILPHASGFFLFWGLSQTICANLTKPWFVAPTGHIHAYSKFIFPEPEPFWNNCAMLTQSLPITCQLFWWLFQLLNQVACEREIAWWLCFVQLIVMRVKSLIIWVYTNDENFMSRCQGICVRHSRRWWHVATMQAKDMGVRHQPQAGASCR